MDNTEVQKQCIELLKQFGNPSFIVFGWEKDGGKFGVTYATHQMPANVAVKGMLWSAHDYANKHI